MEVIVVHSSQAIVFIIGTPSHSLLSIRGNLVRQFYHHFSYWIEVSPIIIVPVVRETTIQREGFCENHRLRVVIPNSPGLLDRVGCLGHVITMGLLVTSPISFLSVG